MSVPASRLPRLAASFALLVGVFIPTVFVISSVTNGGRLRPGDAVAFAAEGILYAVLMMISAVVVRRRRVTSLSSTPSAARSANVDCPTMSTPTSGCR